MGKPTDFDREVEQRAAQIAKLPVWARDLLFDLHRNLAEARTALRECTEGFEGNTTVVDPHGDYPRQIGIDPVVEHAFSGVPGCRVQVEFFADHVTVYENGTRGALLTVHPRNTNTIEIHPLPRSTRS